MAKAAVLNIEVLATVDKALSAFDQLRSKSSSGFDAMKVGAAVAGGALAGELGVATKAAMEHETHVSKLAQTYANVGAPADQMKKALEEIDAQSRRTGQAADDNIDAFNKLMVSSHSTEDAMKDLAVAQDLAAFKGISVVDAASAINKAQQGNTRALKDLGIATTDTSGKQLDAAGIMESLTAAVHGQADAMGDTASGKMARYHESLDQMQVTIGEAVMPALNALLGILSPIMDVLTSNTTVINVLLPVLAGLGAAVVAITTGMKIWTVVQTALNIVLDANPIVLLALAIAGLIAGVVIAYEKVGWFHDAINAVGDAFRVFADWIGQHWQIIIDLLLGPLGLLITHFDLVTDAISTVLDWLKKIKDAASDAFGWLGKVGGFVGKVGGVFGLSAGAGGATPAPVIVAITVAPGDSFPEAVYRGLRDYQRRHARPELASLFG